TPIFIRNGHSEADQKIFEKYKNRDLSQASQEEKKAYERYISFSNLNGKYFIPATSLKGMIRNVLEIISNGKLIQFNDHRHSIRQIMRTKGAEMDEGYELSKDGVKKTIKCGYLIKRQGRFYIHSCGHPLKIRYTDLDEKFGCDFEGQFGSQDKANLSENFDHRTAAYKYDLLPAENIESEFENPPLDENDKPQSWVSKYHPLQYARFTENKINPEEIITGRNVLIGQARTYNEYTARKGEPSFSGGKAG